MAEADSQLFFLLAEQRQSVLAAKEERRLQRQEASAGAEPASSGAQQAVPPATPAAAASEPALALAEGSTCVSANLGVAPSTPAALVLAALACGIPDVPVLLQQRGFAELREGSPLLADAAGEALRALLLRHRSGTDGSPEAVHFAAAALAACSMPDLVRSLLALGADLNGQGMDGRDGSGGSSPPPLVAALLGGHLEAAEVLLDAGAHPEEPTVLAAGAGEPAPMQTDGPLLGGQSPNKRQHGDLAGEVPAAATAAPTPLVLSVAARSPRLVARLLAKGADPNRQCTVLQPGTNVVGGGMVALTPLLAAVHTGNEELVRQLLAAGADVCKGAALPGGDGADWSSPLSAAVLGGSQPVIELLVEAGAAGHSASAGGGTPANSAHAFQPKHALRALALAAQRGQLAAVQLLHPRLAAVVQGGSPALLGVLRRRTTLHPLAAAAQGGHAEVVDWLLDQGSPACHSGSTVAGIAHQTPLMLAAGGGHVMVVERLLAAGADPHHTNAREETAAALALRGGHLAALRCLLLHGGEVEVADDGTLAVAEGMQGLQLASACRVWQLGFGSSGRALLGGHLSLAGMGADRQRFRLLLLALLGAAGGSAAAAAHLRQLATPASVARAAAGSEALLAALLAAGCSPRCVNPADGSFPLLAAAQMGWEPTMRLLRSGADPNQADASGNTVLMLLAARPSLLDTAHRLLAWHAEHLEAAAPQQARQQQRRPLLDVLRLNVEGRDALGVALAAKNRRFAEELLTHLATVGPPAGPPAAAAAAQHASAAVAPAAPTAAASPAAVVARAYEALVERGARQLAHINLPGRDGQLLLLAQARSASRKQLRQVLALPGLDFNVQDSTGRSALHLLVGRQSPALVADLLAAGRCRVELEARDITGATAALLAARGGATGVGVLAVLLAAGADPDCFDAEGRTLLMALAATGQHKLLSEVLQSHVGTSTAATSAVDRRDVRGWTALHHAAAAGAFGACRVLRAHGASPQARTFEGQTPADLVAGNEQCLALLRLPALGEAVDV